MTREQMTDWSNLPDVYVTSASLIDGIFWEITACSVPMAIGPEVRLIRADTIEALQAERDAALQHNRVLLAADRIEAGRAEKAEAEAERLRAGNEGVGRS